MHPDWVGIESFRTQQAIHDLVHAAKAADFPSLGLVPEGRATALDDLVRARHCRFETNADLGLWEDLNRTARGADGGPACHVATAILLADQLHGGMGPEAPHALWKTQHAAYADALPSTRAALLQGFARAAEATLWTVAPLNLDPPPALDSMLTRPAEAILPALRQIALSANRDELRAISRADYGNDANRHFDALRTLLWNQDCVLENGQNWYPGEVIELVAHVRASEGFMACTALLLITALTRGDEQDWFSFRWENLGADYNALPPSVRWPILAGIRYLYESDPGFMGYYTKNYQALGADWLIPVLPDLA